MLVVIDVGNTNISFGIFSADILVKRWRLHSKKNLTASEVQRKIQKNIYLLGGRVSGICIGSVVPRITKILRGLRDVYCDVPFIVAGDKGVRWDIKCHVDDGVTVGEDILLNGIAGFAKYKKALIIVDFGTATTFDVFDGKGDFVGSVITPGINLSLQSLYESAALLPKITIAYRKSVIGKNTRSCMQSGIFWSQFFMIKGLIEKIKTQFQQPCLVVATGGLSKFFAKHVKVFDDVDTTLTLQGLKILAQRNRHNI